MAEVASAESGDSKAETKKESTMEVDEEEDDILSDMQKMGANDITARTRLLDNEVRIMKSEIMRLQHEMQAQKDKIKENTEKIKVCVNTYFHMTSFRIMILIIWIFLNLWTSLIYFNCRSTKHCLS